MKPHAGGVELGLKFGLRGSSRLRPLTGSDRPSAIGEELKLARNVVAHARCLIIARSQTSSRASA
jgi:hypothetical protein